MKIEAHERTNAQWKQRKGTKRRNGENKYERKTTINTNTNQSIAKARINTNAKAKINKSATASMNPNTKAKSCIAQAKEQCVIANKYR